MIRKLKYLAQKLSLSSLFLFFTAYVSAQSSKSTVTGQILDSTNKKPLAFATVCVYTRIDTNLVTYRLSDLDGKFKLPNIPQNSEYRLVITFSGYEVYRKEFDLKSATEQIDFSTIYLTREVKSLGEIIIRAEIPPVLVRKDTIEFNANSFKTLPTALVEDLLKKLPGVSVDANGDIKVNGRKVNRILVDGKNFFGDDPKMATRNLPANIIETVQVMNDKNELEMSPDLSEAFVGQVINLKLKKSIKKGMFGKAYAGIGTDDRYETGAIANVFKDTFQISVLAYRNNLSKAAFGYSDLQSLGGFRRSGSTISVLQNGGFTNNTIAFGGRGNGIQNSGGAGININNELSKKTSLNIQYFYGATKNDIEERSETDQFFGDTIFRSSTAYNAILKAQSHRIGFIVKHRANSLTRFEFKPSVYITDQQNKKNYDYLTLNNFNGKLNSSRNTGYDTLRESVYNHSFLLVNNFKKSGRNLTITNTFFYSKNHNDFVNSAFDSLFYPLPQKTDTLNQLRNIKQNTAVGSINSNFTEPLNKTLSLRINYNFVYGNSGDKVITWDRNPMSGKLELYNNNLSNNLKRQSFRNQLSSGVNWKLKNLSVTALLGILRLDLDNKFAANANASGSHYNFITPSLSVNFKEISFSYNNSVTPPSIADIRPIADSSNPLFIFKGNPKLLPSVSHNLGLNYFKYNTQKFLTTNIYITGRVVEDQFIYKRNIDKSGRQTTMPVNTNNIYDATIFSSVEKQLKINKEFRITLRADVSYTRLRGITYYNEVKSNIDINEFNPTLQARFNWGDLIELSLSGNTTFSRSHFENPIFSNQKTGTYRSYNEFILRWPKNVVFESNITYRYNSDVDRAIQRSYVLWNAGITYLFLKDNRGQLKLYVFDLLDQNISISRYASENYITSFQSNILKQYTMLTFSYDLRGVNYKKAGGSNRLLLF